MPINWSPQYKKLHGNQESIIRILNANKSATDSLCRKLTEKRWIDALDDHSPKRLMRVVLTRVVNDASEFYQFKSCVDEVPGLDQISKKLVVDRTAEGHLTLYCDHYYV